MLIKISDVSEKVIKEVYNDETSSRNRARETATILGGTALGTGIGASPLGREALVRLSAYRGKKVLKQLGMDSKENNAAVLKGARDVFKESPELLRRVRLGGAALGGLAGTVLGAGIAAKYSIGRDKK